jgi:hypothetical protein
VEDRPTARFFAALGLWVPLLSGCAADGAELPPERRPDAMPIAEADARDALVEALCRHRGDCACPIQTEEGASVDTTAACESTFGAVVDAYFEAAGTLLLTYDDVCVGEIVRDLDWQACAPPGDDRATTCAQRCAPVFGVQDVGEPCVELARVEPLHSALPLSNCAQGLECRWDVCVEALPFCEGAHEGQSCEVNGNPPCAENLNCAFDEGQFMCEAFGRLGDPCDFWPCNEGVCDPNSFVCEPPPTLGQACTTSCEPGDSYCNASGACAALLPDGERCTGHPDCVSGYCPDGWCTGRPEEGEICFGPCVEGLDCVDQICRAPVGAVCGPP